MTHPLVHEFSRTLRSWFVLVPVALMFLASLTIVPMVSFSGGPNGTGEAIPLTYYNGQSYVVFAYVCNQFGQPLNGVSGTFTLNGTFGNFTTTASSSSQGYLNMSIMYPHVLTVGYSPGSTNYTRFDIHIGDFFGESGILQNITTGWVSPAFIPYKTDQSVSFSTVVNGSSPGSVNILAFGAGDNGSLLQGVSIYYLEYTTSGGPPKTTNGEGSMNYSGALTGYHQIFSAPSMNNATSQSGLEVAAFSPNGTQLGSAFFQFSSLSNTQPLSNISPLSYALEQASSIFSIFVPIVAVLGAYVSYGSDRVTGAIEPVLARSVTRKGLAISRYVSTMFALGLAVVGTLLVDDLLFYALTGSSFNGVDLLVIAVALLVDLAAFVSMVFIISQFVKSTGALIGSVVALALVFSFLWQVVVVLIASLTSAQFGSVGFLKAIVLSDFINPSGFTSLVSILLTNNLQYAAVQPSAYGVTWLTVGAAMAAWCIIPFLIFVYLVTKRD